jgi:hypothetical protein
MVAPALLIVEIERLVCRPWVDEQRPCGLLNVSLDAHDERGGQQAASPKQK